ncbi:PAS sensor domain-containing protein [Methylocucumis oryzae]|uniref:PAS sensor protein n=1 Tax=Methylocucumis oryzae TaxID=1632867 RepID=A0A0F3ILY9_9GAMM|nr:PAS sensor domain-containing protein [Methylocucumis oryzae]KJV07677.1 PAS sensor protein [Methylocucumis oryzae]
MPFIVKKDNGLIPQVLTAILDECVNGVTLADPDLEDCPIIYANKAFERLTGYRDEDIVGKNCRFLQGEDRSQDARYKIKEAMKNHEVVEVTLRNYKKDGTLFHNHLKVTPLLDSKGVVLYYLGVQYDITYQVDTESEIKRLSDLLNL